MARPLAGPEGEVTKLTPQAPPSLVPTLTPGSFGHVARQSGVAVAAQLAGVLLRFVIAVLIARLQGASALGLYVLTLTLASGATLLATAGLDRAATRFVSHHRGREEGGETLGVLFFTCLVAGGAAAILGASLYFAAPTLATWLDHPQLTSPTRVMAVAIPLLALGQVSRAGLYGFQDVRLAVILEQVVIPGATALLFVVLYVGRPANSIAAVLAAAVAQSSVGLASWVAVAGRLRRQPTAPVFRVLEWMRFSVVMWLEQWMFFLVGAVAYAFVARYQDTQAVGVYASAARVAALVGLPVLAVSSVFGPAISNLAARGDWNRLSDVYARLTWTLLLIGVTGALVVGGAGRWVVRAFGPGFSAASAPLLILVVGQVVNCATGPSGLMLAMTGRTGWRLANASVAAVSAVGMSWVFVPRWGVTGAAAAGVVASSVVNVVQVFQVRHLLGMWAYARLSARR
ncbi:MAG TPA: oligosaccharide flippase family protein [Acidimicrobiales bacterium]|nr:oligosaccharide flippase family protein [Acidimicrobiales bacterium]